MLLTSLLKPKVSLARKRSEAQSHLNANGGMFYIII